MGDPLFVSVGLIGRYSNHSFTEVNWLNLERLHERARVGRRDSATNIQTIRDVDRRLGQPTLVQIAADYEAGSSTIQLTKRYKISKSTVLRILRDQHVMMRPGTRKQGPISR